ncbi:sugar ABC transporter ATP-binding protein [uncultured Jannaschia sp.]|uniref:ATP-binding cassette domain-containing protein n=1 Tax=uncultured Jannaschia sp. TaxID=293347 RepID=UPI002627BCE8|nr:sugar ABC transporter ATP-binding protein [uncultured Jannaschia sp.]
MGHDDRAPARGTGGAVGATPIVRFEGTGRAFGAVRALHPSDFAVRPGECVALVGHNGAGKSTLVNLVNAVFPPSEGAVVYDLPPGAAPAGRSFEAGAVRARRAAGVRAVHQELSLAPNLSVLENLRIAQRDLAGRGWRRRASDRMRASLDAVFPGNRIPTRAVVGDLALAERQMVEIAMGFADGMEPARLVILDEPTSSLDASVAAQLVAHVRAFCASGGAAIFISHMMAEVFDIADRIAVMRDGRIVEDRPASAFTQRSLVAAMGHVAPEATAAARAAPSGPDILGADHGLSARAGEIVGLAGLAGHGQAEALSRLYLALSSDWRAAGAPRAAFVAGDRARDGLFPLWSIRRNVSAAGLGRLVRRGLVDRAAEAALARDWKARIGIRTDDLSAPILSLSGGNQQKVLFARALATGAPVVVMDDPMRGVDVGTKAQVYDIIRAEAGAGRTFLWYSTEMDEIRLCDRVFVYRNGRIGAELRGDAITGEAIVASSFEMEAEA